MRIPQWYCDYKDQILGNVHNLKVIKSYNLFHDIGKPFCRTVDAEGRQHFPDHAEVSKKVWLEHFKDPVIGNLIGLDMAIHTLSKEEIKALNLSVKDAMTLLITSLAEVHANAELFGGIQTDSFKIKWKKIDKIGKFLCDLYFNHAYIYVIVRKDLTSAQKAVQSAHACIESARTFVKPQDEHPSVIICEVKSEVKLKMIMEELEGKVEYRTFQESDLNNEYTALASAPIYGEQRRLFSRFQLIQ